MGGGDGRQPRRDAGARVGDALPERIRHALVIAAAPNLSAQNIAFNEVARQAILTDPDFHDGHFDAHGTKPRRGLIVARMIGHITYLSDEQMAVALRPRAARRAQVLVRTGIPDRVLSSPSGREVRRVLRREHVSARDQGARLLRSGRSGQAAISRARSPPRSAGSSSSRSRPTGGSRRPARARSSRRSSTTGATSSYAEIVAAHGHDAFLLDAPQYMGVVRAYFDRIAAELGGSSEASTPSTSNGKRDPSRAAVAVDPPAVEGRFRRD